MNIRIENISGIWYFNAKRIGYDMITPAELSAVNEFIKEIKDLENQKSRYHGNN
ncbi:hypothetical protein [Chryseobacterium sp. Leaf180]|uniref:hypothetical protein n=1 Tax=Chryseobacterium sp. Leaf180 TaxID=1736289 RepID=UPI000A6C40A0|nr:hypothetical protein [Chryseobacterium sp. Leaf180]